MNGIAEKRLARGFQTRVKFAERIDPTRARWTRRIHSGGCAVLIDPLSFSPGFLVAAFPPFRFP